MLVMFVNLSLFLLAYDSSMTHMPGVSNSCFSGVSGLGRGLWNSQPWLTIVGWKMVRGEGQG